MKILLIPDPHQTTIGIEFAKENIGSVDKVIVLGDYVDNWESKKMWDIPENNPLAIIDKFVEFKNENDSKVDLLLGNHDISYLSKALYGNSVSGHQGAHEKLIREEFEKHLSSFKIAVEYDSIVFSHAGFSSFWVDSVTSKHRADKKDVINLCNSFVSDDKLSEFDFNGYNAFGDDITQGPTWIRPLSLMSNMFFSKQVVGHTEIKEENAPLLLKDGDKKLLIVDTAEHNLFLTLNTETFEWNKQK